jgi:CBS domain-containing protein
MATPKEPPPSRRARPNPDKVERRVDFLALDRMSTGRPGNVMEDLYLAQIKRYDAAPTPAPWERLPALTARDVASPKVISIQLDDSMSNVVDLLDRHQVSGIAVLDRAGALQGVISATDVVRFHAQCHVSVRKWLQETQSEPASCSTLAQARARGELQSTGQVRDFYSPVVYTARPQTSLLDVADIMTRHQVSRLFLLEGDRLVGVVTASDLVRTLARVSRATDSGKSSSSAVRIP